MKREVAKVKHKACEELYDKLDTKERRKRFVQVGKTEKSSWEECAGGEVDQGQEWEYYHK